MVVGRVRPAGRGAASWASVGEAGGPFCMPPPLLLPVRLSRTWPPWKVLRMVEPRARRLRSPAGGARLWLEGEAGGARAVPELQEEGHIMSAWAPHPFDPSLCWPGGDQTLQPSGAAWLCPAQAWCRFSQLASAQAVGATRLSPAIRTSGTKQCDPGGLSECSSGSTQGREAKVKGTWIQDHFLAGASQERGNFPLIFFRCGKGSEISVESRDQISTFYVPRPAWVSASKP